MPQVVVETGARLHFGLFSAHRQSGRNFGGLGLMIKQPGISLQASSSNVDEISGGTESGRARLNSVLSELRKNSWTANKPVKLQIRSAMEEHVGLGSGTQLALAVAAAWYRLHDRSTSINELTKGTGRGKRSGIGAHGFLKGGLIADGGRIADRGVAPMIAQVSFPDWPIVLIQPELPVGLHGPSEQDALTENFVIPQNVTETLCRIAFLELLPAVHERDFESFATALGEYNRRSGECFASVQGGAYAHRELTAIVAELNEHGYSGVGQSSWGPTLFAVAKDRDDAERMQTLLERSRPALKQKISLTAAKNDGAHIAWCEDSDR